MHSNSYTEADVTAYRVTPQHTDADGVYTWWVRDILHDGEEGGACGVDAATAYEAATMWAASDGLALSDSFTIEGDTATYHVAGRL